MEAERCEDPANELLPWYLNGSLEQAAAELVRDHLGRCSICSRELDELAAMAGELEARRGAGPSPQPVPRATHRRRQPLRLALAAVLVLIALLTGYWIRKRSVSSPGSPARAEDSVVSLDLRSGPTRGAGFLPTIVLSRNVRWVNLRLTAPVNAEAVYQMELRSSSGETLTRGPKAPLTLDRLGRATFEVGANLLSPPGNFELHLWEFETSGALHEYPYPFRVVKLP